MSTRTTDASKSVHKEAECNSCKTSGHSYSQNHISGNARVHFGDVIQNLEPGSDEAANDRECHRTFKCSAYEEHKNINPDRVSGTCEWLLRHPQYHQWHNSMHDDLLWISADPGCGKSVFAKSLIDKELRNIDQSLVCYFFFKDTEEQDNLSNALCAIIHQLFAQQTRLISHARKAWKDSGAKVTKDVSELWQIWTSAARDAQAQTVVCVFDALDECRDGDRGRLIDMLTAFYVRAQRSSRQSVRLKFLITSRPYDDIQYQFERVPKDLPELRLRGEDENDAIHAEINLVIDVKVKELASEFNLATTVSEQLKDKLISMEHRTYLWLYLALGSIRKEYRDSLRPQQVSISTLPRSVEDAYNRILSKIEQHQQSTVMQILKIIVGARRALKVGELALALGTALCTDPKEFGDIRIDTMHLKRQLRQWCALFVFINHGRLYLIHQTAKEFLLQQPSKASPQLGLWSHSFDPLSVELSLTQICVNFISLQDHNMLDRNTNVLDTSDNSSFDEEDPEDETTTTDAERGLDEKGADFKQDAKEFLQYSAQHWPSHMITADLDEKHPFMSKVIQLFNPDEKIFQSWFPVFWRETQKPGDRPMCGRLQTAAIVGHGKLVAAMLYDDPSCVNVKDASNKTALKWACELGSEKVVSILLDHGAQVNVQESFSAATPVVLAHRYLKAPTVSGLPVPQSYHDSGPLTRSGLETSVHAAARMGNTRIMKLLLEHGAKIASQRSDGVTPFFLACVYGRPAMAKIILSDLNAKSKPWNICDKRKRTILHYLLAHRMAPSEFWYGRYKEIISMLLASSRSTDVNAQDEEGVSPFHLAMQGKDIAIVQKMLALGAKHSLRDRNGQFPVHYIGKTRWWAAPDVAQLALESFPLKHTKQSDLQAGICSSINMNVRAAAALRQRDKFGQTPLHTAIANEAYEVVAFFLQYNTELTIRDNMNRTALDLAFDVRHQSVKDLLLAASRNRGPMEIHIAACSGYTLKLSDLLTQNKLHIDIAGEDGQTPLHYAALGGNIDAVQVLLRHGANGCLRDAFGQTALHIAAAQGHYDIVKFLLHDLTRWIKSLNYFSFFEGWTHLQDLTDPNVKDRAGQTPLHFASDGGHLEVAMLLLDAGAQVGAPLATGITPLYRAAYWNHDAVVELLLQSGARSYGRLPWEQMSDETLQLLKIYLDTSEFESQDEVGSGDLT